MDAYIGFDTSCYTTSMAMVDDNGKLLSDKRNVLQVKRGEKGLRQSEAVFQHIRNLNGLSDELKVLAGRFDVKAVAASVKPRPLPESYMPVFTVGESTAKAAAAAAGIPFYATTHQESHLMAGLWSAGGPKADRFLTVHLSGGTTELLITQKKDPDFEISIIGGTRDISAGQFVDRIGVAMGLDFPCGPQLEELAGRAIGTAPALEIPCSSKGCTLSFSGPETHARRLLQTGADEALVALLVLKCIARGLEKIISEACRTNNIKEVLMVGGVSANKMIKSHLEEKLDCRQYFPHPKYCSDSGVGTAVIAREKNM